eukprot:CAMPEP_0194047994 /NCGR_PEP_ID=MMETSP0009_2-20130614/26492_1 /TAXON_ID=210454 /ORGANISM="Grammatophora oceanica, Strain CCMP 410" /LENGTH=146 /DNA_ID=CAMNT_0038693771 /DNA_START=39 /DNA_END=479 /DNA_ORIENTATION=-
MTATTRAAASLLLRRSVVSTTRRNTSLRGGMTPPLPPFQQLPKPSQKLSEDNDAIWDDGVAPELAFDFDVQNVSTLEAIMTLGAMFGFVGTIYYTIKQMDPEGQNPAVSREELNCVGPNLLDGRSKEAAEHIAKLGIVKTHRVMDP